MFKMNIKNKMGELSWKNDFERTVPPFLSEQSRLKKMSELSRRNRPGRNWFLSEPSQSQIEQFLSYLFPKFQASNYL